MAQASGGSAILIPTVLCAGCARADGLPTYRPGIQHTMALRAAALLLLLPALAAALGADPQAAALLHIRSGFTNGEELLDWNHTTAHPCGWVGVGCDSGDVMYL